MVRIAPRAAALTEVKGLKSHAASMTSLASHPQRNSVRLQLRQNPLLQGISNAQWSELEPLLLVADYRKGDPLVRQGDEEMEQFFILEGMLKRVVSNPEGREMILRFAAENEMDTSLRRLAPAHAGALLDRRGDQGAHRRAADAGVGRVPRAATASSRSASSTR